MPKLIMSWIRLIFCYQMTDFKVKNLNLVRKSFAIFYTIQYE